MAKIKEGTGIQENILANGVLAAVEAEIYACPAMSQARLTTVVCHNTHAANTNTVQLFLRPSGGTSRRIANQALLPGASLKGKDGIVEPLRLNEGDSLRGEATNAGEVAWTISGVEESVI